MIRNWRGKRGRCPFCLITVCPSVCTLELREIFRNHEKLFKFALDTNSTYRYKQYVPLQVVRTVTSSTYRYKQYVPILLSSSILNHQVFIFRVEFTFKSVKLLVIRTLKYVANYFLTEITEITQSEIHCVQCTAHSAGMTYCKFTNGRFILVYILLTIWPSFGPLCILLVGLLFFILLQQARRQWVGLIRLWL
jgi:hypothetical protein